MAWANGNKRWTIPFLSLAGKSCKIDIYKRGYTSSTVSTLATNVSGAVGCAGAQPFYFEEDDDESLLTVIRVKTGYINLIELTYGGLDDLRPTTNNEHYIEVYYGTDLMFTGFMQAQTFETEWKPAPREVSFPVISPLGLMDSYKFTAKNPPSLLTFKELFLEIMNGSDSVYGFVDVAALSLTTPTTTQNVFTDLKVKSLVVSPFKTATDNGTDVFEPQTYLYFIEAVCNAFGLIAHDVPGGLVLSKFDNSNGYAVRLTPTGSGTMSIIYDDTTHAMGDIFDVQGTDNEESTILPLKQIEINYEGDSQREISLNYDRCQKSQGSIQLTGWSLVNCACHDGCLSANNVVSANIDSNGNLTTPGTAFIAAGTDEMTEQILTLYSPGVGICLWKWIVPEWCNNTGRLSFKVMKGGGINSLGEYDDYEQTNLLIYLSCGGKKYNAQTNSWGDTAYAFSVLGLGNKEITIYQAPGNYAPLEIEVYRSGGTVAFTFSFQNIQLKTSTSMVGEYLGLYNRNMSRTLQGTPSPYDGEVDAEIGKYLTVYDRYVDGTDALASNPTYQYLLASAQNRLIVSGKVDVSDQDAGWLKNYPYLSKLSFWRPSWKWRIIGMNFSPRDDQWTMILHHSTTID